MHCKSRNDSAWILRFSECIAILSRVDSELSFEQQVALHALETAVFYIKKSYLYKIHLFHTECSSNLFTYLLTYHSRLTYIKSKMIPFHAKYGIFRVSMFLLLYARGCYYASPE